jgi:hypothetical protein
MAKAPDDKTDTDPEPLRRNWVGQVSDDANAAASSAFARAGFRDPTLVLHWAKIAGPEIARMATPVKLTESPGGGATLTLKAEPGAAVFLQHQTRTLCDRINAYLGRPAVSRLRFVQGPLIHRAKPPPRPVRPASAPPGDAAFGYRGPDKLKNALINLARARRLPPASD